MIVNPVLYQQGTKLPELANPGTAADLLAGKQLVDQYGNPLTGTMPEVAQATPSISVSSSGLITANAAQDAGHVAAGTKSATKQLTTQAGKTVTPTTNRQTAVSSGRYTTGAVYVAGDANLVAGNIKSGVSIFGVTGNCKTSPRILTITTDMVVTGSNGIDIYTGLKNCILVSIAARIGFYSKNEYSVMGPYTNSGSENRIQWWAFLPEGGADIGFMSLETNGLIHVTDYNPSAELRFVVGTICCVE